MELESFFANKNDFNTFCSLLAKGRIISKEKEIDDFKQEIDDSISKCSDIFNNYGSEVNFITEILDLENRFQSVENGRYNSSELDALNSRKEELYEKYNAFISTLPLSVKEDLEFYSKRVIDRENRLKDTNNLIREIDHNYPEARNLDVEKVFKEVPLLVEINKFLNPDEEEIEIEDTVSMPYATRITEAPDELIEKDNKSIEVSNDNIEIPKEPDTIIEVNHDNSFFDPTDAFSSAIETGEDLSGLFTEPVVEEPEPEKFEFTDEQIISPLFIEPAVETSVLNEESNDKSFTETPDNQEDIKTFHEDNNISETEKSLKDIELEPEEKSEDLDLDTTVSTENICYPMANGLSLSSLAEAACGSASGWIDIYENNKDIIDERLNLNGLTIEEAKDNDIALSGLTLEIPNVYNHLKEEENNLSEIKKVA